MKNYHSLPSYLLSLLALFSSAAFSTSETCISVIASGGITRPYWSQVINGAYKAGDELGIALYVRGTVNDKDALAQQQIIKTAVDEKHCSAIVIAPSDASVNEVVADLKARNIPTIYVDRDTGGERAAYVATDNYAAGVLAAQKMAEVVKEGESVVLFRLKQGVASTDAREQGFIEKASELGLNIVADPYVGTRVGESRNIIRTTLETHPEAVGIFTPNDTTTIAAILMRQDLPATKPIHHIGFDQTPFIQDSLKKGELQGYIAQNPFEMGYQGVHMAVKLLNGDSSVANTNTAVNYYE